jgi:hypothetical protein
MSVSGSPDPTGPARTGHPERERRATTTGHAGGERWSGLRHDEGWERRPESWEWVGEKIQIRYSAERPNDEVAPADEDRITPVLPFRAVPVLAGLLFTWWRPEAMLSSGFRRSH